MVLLSAVDGEILLLPVRVLHFENVRTLLPILLYRVAQKVSHYQLIKNCIVLKSFNEIRFLRQIKEMIKQYNVIRRY